MMYRGSFDPFSNRNILLDNTPSPPDEWELHTKYGVIHKCPCTTCREYIRHLAPFWSCSAQHKSSKHPTPVYDAFYKDGIREGIAFGAAQVMELEDELDRVRLDKANAVSLLGEQERMVEELRGEVRALEEEMAELRRAKTPESWKDESSAKVSVSPSMQGGRPSVPWARVVAAGLSVSTSVMMSLPGDARPRAEATGSRPQNPDSNPSSLSNGLPPPQVARANRLPQGPPSPSSVRAHRGHSISISSSLSSNTHRVPPTSLNQGGFQVPRRPGSPKTNPRLHDSVETWFDYYCTHKKSWPQGVRCDSQRRPILADLRADRAIARFRPAASVRVPQDTTTSSAAGTIMSTRESDNSVVGGAEACFPAPSPRNQFKNMAVSLFCQQGLYAKRVRELGLSIAPSETYDEYTGPFPITIDDVVRHLARAGVTTEGLAVDLETWARNYEAGVNCSIPFTPSSVVQRMRRR